jgi:hypothetical protein
MIWILELKMLHLKQICSTCIGIFDQIANVIMEDLFYVYLHYGLLNKVTLITIGWNCLLP